MLLMMLALAIQSALPGIGTEQPAPPQTQSPDARQERADDILIEGSALPDTPPRTELESQASTSFKSHRAYEIAEIFAKCAIPRNIDRIREIVDGEPNSSSFRFAIEWLATTNPACQLDRDMSPSAAVRSGAFDPVSGMTVNKNLYRRGAVLDFVFDHYAPELSLTRKMVMDPAVQARFNAREAPRNRLRLPADYRYFEVAVCMVREEPSLAVALVKADAGSPRAGRVAGRLVDGARICVGDAQKVIVNPVEFRIYIADAVYRWTVAARGVASLLPPA